MKTIRRNLALVLAGMMLGAVLSGPAASAAEQLLAQRSTQQIYIDGRQTPMEAYSISGSNYVKLRDIGKVVGFGVSYDAADNAVRIDTTAPYTDDAAAQVPPAAGQGEILLYVPDVGDRIICDDGYVYEITDMSRYGTNVFQKEPLGELPTPTRDWSAFPKLTLPRMEKRHFTTPTGGELFVRNMMETRRMEYTIYNALGSEPSAWRDGQPLATVSLTIPADKEPYVAFFWPWDSSNITGLVHSRPLSRYYYACLADFAPIVSHILSHRKAEI